jgi:putative MATE family efflux protein
MILISRDKQFYKKLFFIAGPISIQNLLMSSLALVDIVMIGQLGEAAIAAVGLGGQVFFLSTLFFYGISSGGSVFFAQFWGRKDTKSIKKTMGMVILFAESGAVALSLIAIFLPEPVMNIFTRDQHVITAGAEYLRVTGISFIFTGLSIAFSLALRSIGNASLPLKATIVSISVNTVLNYILIFGKLGFPAMGIMGAAIATTISRLIEMVIIVFYVYKSGNVLAARFSDAANITLGFVKKYLKTTVPVVMTELAWAMGMLVYKIVYARMGTDSIAIIGITETTTNLIFSFLLGSANACAIMVGNTIGERDIDTVKVYSRRFILISVIMGVLTGGFLALLAPVIPIFFNVSLSVRNSSTTVIYIFSLFVLFKSINLHFVIGMFRGGGDTKIAFLIDIIGTWFLGVPLGIIFGLFLNFPLHLVVVLISMEEILKVVLGFYRYRTNKWIHDVVN